MKNLSQFGPAVWAVGGGAIDFGQCTSCISGTSVDRESEGRGRDVGERGMEEEEDDDEEEEEEEEELRRKRKNNWEG